MDVEEVVSGVLEGDRRATARAISMVEDGADDLPELIEGLFPKTGNAYSVGLTGSPGVGKSSLAAELVKVVRSRDRSVAVLAIDPTSPFTGGALLGDRLRMQTHATDPEVFIRSMATRGHLGGLALAAPEAVRVLDASGADIILIETVGVGQAEVEVATAADTTLVVVAPGWGDAVQASKAGILEIADVFVVNKADRDGVEATYRDIQGMIALGERGPGEWRPQVVRSVAVRGEGIEGVIAAIAKHRAWLEERGELQRRRERRAAVEVEEIALGALRAKIGSLREGTALPMLAAPAGLVVVLAPNGVAPERCTPVFMYASLS